MHKLEREHLNAHYLVDIWKIGGGKIENSKIGTTAALVRGSDFFLVPMRTKRF